MRRILWTAICLSCTIGNKAQVDNVLANGASAIKPRPITLTGSIQSDILFPQQDSDIGAQASGNVLANTYFDLQLHSQYVEAGASVEYLEHQLKRLCVLGHA